ncbi:MAG: YggU family protein [Candidatus Omnitrophica bacterium]|nr:YggU family protein [Candidatus Omnitrophota bacterium]
MNIEIKVIPNAKKNMMKEEDGAWKIHLQAPAVDGKANKALVRLLADYFQVRKTQIEIIKGLKSRHKTISIEGI